MKQRLRKMETLLLQNGFAGYAGPVADFQRHLKLPTLLLSRIISTSR